MALRKNDKDNIQDDGMLPIEGGSPQTPLLVSSRCYHQMCDHHVVKKYHAFALLLCAVFFANILFFTGSILYQKTGSGLDFRSTTVTRTSAVSPPLSNEDEYSLDVTAVSATNEEEQQQTHVVETAATSTSTGGPVPFCQMSFTLYRTDIHDMICNKGNVITSSFGIIPQSKQKSIQFLHIPKTGGESLERMLHIRKSHATWWERRAWHTGNSTREGFSLTIIRNPFDRMYSWFKFCLHGYRRDLPLPYEQCLKAHHAIHSQEGPHNLTSVSLAFEEWIRKLFLDPKLSHHPWITLPAHAFLGGISPLHVDYIIRFEHYSEDFELLAHALGKNTSLVHDNGSASNDSGRLDGRNRFKLTYDEKVGELLKAPYHDVYTDSAKRMVETYFAIDLITFNYTY
jgi:Sulfotransferase family.